jgi:hypothetical protein
MIARIGPDGPTIDPSAIGVPAATTLVLHVTTWQGWRYLAHADPEPAQLEPEPRK